MSASHRLGQDRALRIRWRPGRGRVALRSLLAGLLLTAPGAASAAPGFYGLDDLPDGSTSADLLWVSDSGLAGGSIRDPSGGGTRAIVYSIDAGLRLFETLPGGVAEALHVSGGSRDGATLVGRASTEQGIQGFRYSEATGSVFLAPREAGTPTDDWSHAFANDADRVVGTSNGVASIWEGSSSPTLLGGLNPAYVSSYAYDASSDGRRVVGKVRNEFFEFQAFVWTEGDGMRGLGPASRFGYSEAVAISADGSVVVGTTLAGFYTPFIWTDSEGMRLLDAPAGFSWGLYADSFFSLDVSGDGRVIVGSGLWNFEQGSVAFIHTPTEGVRPLSDYLELLGIDLAGWTLTEARGISKDGRFIVGSGIDPSGRSSGWLVVVPEPNSALLVALGLVALRGLGTPQSARPRPARSIRSSRSRRVA